jgi:sarcosine oxidase, subunit gamma
MSDLATIAQRRNPLHGLSLPSRIGQLIVTDAGPATRFVCRGNADALGAGFSQKPLHATRSGQRIALHLGPDEWWLIAPESERDALIASSYALPPGNSAVDVSHRDAALILDGPAVGEVLNAGCPLDFDLAAFPVGMCTRTIFGKAEIVLWREAENRFRLDAGRSFMPYITGLLTEAVRDLA